MITKIATRVYETNGRYISEVRREQLCNMGACYVYLRNHIRYNKKTNLPTKMFNIQVNKRAMMRHENFLDYANGATDWKRFAEVATDIVYQTFRKSP